MANSIFIWPGNITFSGTITMSGNLTVNGTFTVPAVTFTGGSVLEGSSTNIIEQRNGTSAQTLRIYNTYATAGTDFERLNVGVTSANRFGVTVTAGGTGTVRPLDMLGSNINFATSVGNSWAMTASGHLTAASDNQFDIGASGATRPRTLYLGTSLVLPGGTLLTTSAALTNGAAAQNATMTNGPTAGNPTKWIPINDNGTTRYIPAW